VTFPKKSAPYLKDKEHHTLSNKASGQG